MLYYHIKTSVRGSHSNCQDAVRYFEDENVIIAVVADGLGSRRHSADGARLICGFITREMTGKTLPLDTDNINSIDDWYSYLENKGLDHNDYCTTCSFAVISKMSKRVCLGQIGDSPIFACFDGTGVVAIRPDKEFSNLTDCLGGGTRPPGFSLFNYEYVTDFKILISSDGIGDELNTSWLNSMLCYLSDKYQGFSQKSRSRKFTKEIKSTFGDVNHDDKSAIYIWAQ